MARSGTDMGKTQPVQKPPHRGFRHLDFKVTRNHGLLVVAPTIPQVPQTLGDMGLATLKELAESEMAENAGCFVTVEHSTAAPSGT